MKVAQIKKWGRWRIAWACPENIEVVGDLLRSGEVDGVGLSPYYGFTGDPSFLNDLPTFAGIVVNKTGSLDFRKLAHFNKVHFLSLGEERLRGSDLSGFTSLIDLRMNWHVDDTLPASGKFLEYLSIRGYESKSKDLKDFSSFSKLEDLKLEGSNITSLVGARKLKSLRQIELNSCRGLVAIAALKYTPVERISLCCCDGVKDFHLLSKCADLRSISLVACGTLQSLRFIEKSKSLEEFKLMKMRVIDSDVSPLFDLKSVGFFGGYGSCSYSKVDGVGYLDKCVGDSSESRDGGISGWGIYFKSLYNRFSQFLRALKRPRRSRSGK